MNSGMFGRKWQRCGGHQQRQRQHRGQQQGTSLRGRGRQWRVSKWRVPLRRVRAGRSHNDRAAKWTGRGWGRGRGRGWRIDAPRGVRDIQDPESQLGWQHKADSRIASMERSCLTAKIWLASKTSDNILNFSSNVNNTAEFCLIFKKIHLSGSKLPIWKKIGSLWPAWSGAHASTRKFVIFQVSKNDLLFVSL